MRKLYRDVLRRLSLHRLRSHPWRRRHRPKSTCGSRAKTETLFEGPVSTEPPRRQGDLRHGRNRTAATGSTTATRTPRPGPDPDRRLGRRDGIDRRSLRRPVVPGLRRLLHHPLGPRRAERDAGEYWGLLVNNVFTNVGGCQYQVDGGDEVLWVYDAFKERPLLALFPAATTLGAATADRHRRRWANRSKSRSPPTKTTPRASRRPARSGPAPTPSRAPTSHRWRSVPGASRRSTRRARRRSKRARTGKATITFADTGLAPDQGDRWPAPAKRKPRSAPTGSTSACSIHPPKPTAGRFPRTIWLGPHRVRSGKNPGRRKPEVGGEQAGSAAKGSGAEISPVTDPGQVHLQLPHLDRSHIARGLVRVSWRVLDAGVGIAKWTISSKTLGRRGPRDVTRASGTSATSASLRLPPGATYRLRLTIVDTLGRSSTVTIGKVQVPG